MTAPLTSKDLDGFECGCGEPCNVEHPLMLQGKCHPGWPVTASYAAGVLTIGCDLCKAPVCRIAVEGWQAIQSEREASKQDAGSVWVAPCETCGADGCGAAAPCPYDKGKRCNCCGPCRAQCLEDS